MNEQEKQKVVLGEEAAQSVTIQMYYKGYSILLTGRDPNTKLAPILEKAIEAIDQISKYPDMQPSWNTETNKAQKQLPIDKSTEWLDQPTDLGNCKRCGAPNKLSKQGKAYCSKVCWKK